MNRNPAIVAACSGAAILAMSFALLYAPDETDHEAAINQTIDAFHQAAAEADLDAYFGLMTPDARFLGTDATERWTKAEFLAYCQDRGAFDEPPAWIYTPSARAIDLADGAETAWFDELLTHDRYGTLRGSGVLTRTAGTNWKIAQYNLTFLVPNEKTPAVVAAISLPSPPSGGEGQGEGAPNLPPSPPNSNEARGAGGEGGTNQSDRN